MYELVLKVIFEEKVSISTGPDEPLSARFKKEWSTIKSMEYESGISLPDVVNALNGIIEPTKKFILEQLNKKICRHDYRELLELSLKFLGEKSVDKTEFHPPGPIHLAR